jgi:hypothetical protein
LLPSAQARPVSGLVANSPAYEWEAVFTVSKVSCRASISSTGYTSRTRKSYSVSFPASMLCVVPQQAIAARNHIMDVWIDDLVADHEALATSCSQNQRPLLPKFHPSPTISPNDTPSALSYALSPTNQRVKRKREPHPLHDTDSNMNPIPPQPLPPPALKLGTTKMQSKKGRRREKSDETEENIEAQGEKTTRPKCAPITRSVSSALARRRRVHNAGEQKGTELGLCKDCVDSKMPSSRTSLSTLLKGRLPCR